MNSSPSTCLDPDEALAFAAGELDGEAATRVEQHIDGCPDCAELIAHLVRGPLGVQVAASRSPGPSTPSDGTGGHRSLVAGERIGRYEIVSERGRGGMGVVYVAQDLGLRRQVAIKLVRSGGAGSEGRSRLLREARSLARLAHRNVVAVFDVGEFEEQVFIAMEFVDGPTLGQWATGRPRSEVLAAFIDAGEGLQAAHDRGLVHRDFKPSNVIVTDERRVVVLDFGLAYVNEGDASLSSEPVELPSLDTSSFVTQSNAVLGTPAYMSPEQRWGRVTDARSDQYSFCVALYEALWSVHPFRVKGARFDRPPQPPRAERGRLWPIVARGLALEPDDRYPRMKDLLDQLRDVARPRRRGLYAGLATVAAAAAAMASWPSDPSRNCEAVADRLAWSPQVASAIDDSFRQTDLPHAADASQRVRGRLDAFVAQWGTVAGGACRARAEATETEAVLDAWTICLEDARLELATTLEVLRSADRQTVNAADDIVERLGDPTACTDPRQVTESAEQIDVRRRLDAATTVFDGGQVTEGLQRARDAEARMAAWGHSEAHARALVVLGRLLTKAGRLEDSKERYYAAAWMADSLGADRASVEAWTELVWIHGYHEQDLQRAREALRHGRAAMSRLGSDDVLEATLERNAGWLALNEGDPSDAEQRFRRAATLVEPDSRDGRMLAIDLGGALQAAGKSAEAVAVLEDVARRMEDAQGAEHPDVAVALNNLGAAYRTLGRVDEVLPLYHRIVGVYETNYGTAHVDTARTRINLGVALMDVERYGEALEQYDAAGEVFRQQFGHAHPMMAWVHDGRGQSFYGLERLDEATREFERAIAIKVESLGPEHPRLAESYADLGIVAFDAGDPERALVHLTRADELLRDGLGETHPQRGFVRNAMGAALLALGRRDEARQMYAWVAGLETVAGTPIEAEARAELEALSG